MSVSGTCLTELPEASAASGGRIVSRALAACRCRERLILSCCSGAQDWTCGVVLMEALPVAGTAQAFGYRYATGHDCNIHRYYGKSSPR
jgi:hypothetical protein